ncbi:pentatricopeptide repeat-containing protein At5g61800 [Phalaenopsis equestris]|uniref:pentatricopeptide repeat-containing protein At5g61800 n=1 Tax=Phalaenopsis equestris TaxID=78828 RepID=UPI0009E61757|nr:pentatricopeptide repeat-containing protein At5g61800 [Phalaenopsis equestris]
MPQRDSVSYGTMITAYSHSGHHDDALHLFDQMQADGFMPDNASLVSYLSSCAHAGELNRGKVIHDHITRNRIELTVSLLTALVDMYAKCGAIEAALELFDGSPIRNLFTWNSIIVGLAMHGYGDLSLAYFDKMGAAGVKPDGITFVGVLVACSHSGLVETAKKLFGEMERVHGVRIELKHYGCMADLLGRAGMIEEAVEMIEAMPEKGDGYVWGGLLAGCRIHRGNVDVAEVAARKLLEIRPGDTGVYSAMARIYADERRWDDVERIGRIMDAVKVKKNVGSSLVQLSPTV